MQNLLKATLPADAQQATLVGRVWIDKTGKIGDNSDRIRNLHENKGFQLVSKDWKRGF